MPSPATIYHRITEIFSGMFFADAIMFVISSMQLACAKKFVGLPILAGGEIGANFLCWRELEHCVFLVVVELLKV